MSKDWKKEFAEALAKDADKDLIDMKAAGDEIAKALSASTVVAKQIEGSMRAAAKSAPGLAKFSISARSAYLSFKEVEIHADLSGAQSTSKLTVEVRVSGNRVREDVIRWTEKGLRLFSGQMEVQGEVDGDEYIGGLVMHYLKNNI